MSFPTLSVVREFSAERLNAVVNDPSVRPWVGGGSHYLDMSEVVADPRNYLLMGEAGGFLLIQIEPGRYEAHSQFLPSGRGQAALQAALDGIEYMFTRTDAMELVTRVPHGNAGALGFVRACRWEKQFTRPNVWQTASGLVGVDYYATTLNSWVLRNDRLIEVGDWFHAKLEAVKGHIHDDDDSHDRYVGAAATMIAHGQVAKGVNFYNHWAAFSGYAKISVIADNPIVLDIQDALLAVRAHDFEVLLCR